jgi:hypothetical protein
MNGEWLPPRSYLRVEENLSSGVLRGVCGNCGCICGWKRVLMCPACDIVFTQITSPYEADRLFCERERPDLEYVVLQWA